MSMAGVLEFMNRNELNVMASKMRESMDRITEARRAILVDLRKRWREDKGCGVTAPQTYPDFSTLKPTIFVARERCTARSVEPENSNTNGLITTAVCGRDAQRKAVSHGMNKPEVIHAAEIPQIAVPRTSRGNTPSG